MEIKECKDCTYFKEIKGSEHGECRRNPCTGATSSSSGFPVTRSTSWCGEFKKHIIPIKVTERLS